MSSDRLWEAPGTLGSNGAVSPALPPRGDCQSRPVVRGGDALALLRHPVAPDIDEVSTGKMSLPAPPGSSATCSTVSVRTFNSPCPLAASGQIAP